MGRLVGQRDARLGADRRRQRTGAGRRHGRGHPRRVHVLERRAADRGDEHQRDRDSDGVAYSGERIGTLANLGGGKYGGRFTWSVNPSRVTVKSSLGGSATKTVQEK